MIISPVRPRFFSVIMLPAFAETTPEYLAALKVKPDLDTANLGLGVLYARAGDRSSSKFYCQAALKSSDNDMRQQARECLSAK